MKKLSFVFLFITTLVFAQEKFHGVYPQDGGLVIEHADCNIVVIDDEILNAQDDKRKFFAHEFVDSKMIQILKDKGYQVFNKSHYHDISKSDINEQDLVFRIEYPRADNQGHKGIIYLSEKNNLKQLKKIAILHSEPYKNSGRYQTLYGRGKKSIKELYSSVPRCSVKGSGNRVNQANYEYDIRKYEIQSCIDSYTTKFNQLNNESKSGNNKFIISLVSGSTAFAGVVFPPLYGVGLGVFALNHLIFNPSLKVQKERVQNGLVIMMGIAQCEKNKEKGLGCDDIQPSVMKKMNDAGERHLKKMTKKMSFSDFSERVANSLALHKTCSDPSLNYRKQSYKKVLKEAKKNF